MTKRRNNSQRGNNTRGGGTKSGGALSRVCRALLWAMAVVVAVVAVAVGVLVACEDCRHRLFAGCMTHVIAPRLVEVHGALKNELLAGAEGDGSLLSGELLELGPGSGTNFQYMRDAPFLRWHGAEVGIFLLPCTVFPFGL
jgi:hypothetical protein